MGIEFAAVMNVPVDHGCQPVVGQTRSVEVCPEMQVEAFRLFIQPT
jgi:hypothetical protein